MKRFLLFIAVGVWQFNQAQLCTSMRYQDTIFHSVDTISSIYFATATPFGVLAQPQDLYLDIYQPANDTLTDRPVIVFEFGGGFTIGWRSEPDIPQFCEYFAKCGYIVASIDYRIGLNPLDTGSTVRAFYRGVQDERAALRFLAAHAQQYKIDTNYIFLTGTSAGCFCAFANTYMTDANRPLSTYGTLLEPDDMGCMDCSGNNQLGHHIPKPKAIVNCWGAVLDTNYITAAVNVPVISFHGDQDILVPYVYGYPFQLPVFPPVYGSVPIHQRLNSQGILNEFHPLVGYSHEPELLAPQVNDTIYNYTRKFLYPLLKPNTSAITGDSIICRGDVAHYSVVNHQGSKYCWTLNGIGNIVSNNGNQISVLWNDTALVSVSMHELNALNAEGDLKTFQTLIKPQAHASFGYNIAQLHVAILNMSSNAGEYWWTFGDGDTSSVVNPIKDYSSGGTYQIQLVAGNGFCSDTFSNIITIDSCPVANFSFQLNGNYGIFHADSTNTSAYYWNFGDGDSVSVNALNVFHIYLQNGTYVVVLRVKNQLGCISEDSVAIVIGTTAISETADDAIQVFYDNISSVIVNEKSDESVTIQLYNSAGQKLKEQDFHRNCIVSLAKLPAGFYLLYVKSSKVELLKKVVKISSD